MGVLGEYYSSPVAADNKVYIASAEGVVVVLDAGEELKILARHKLDGAILATPGVSRREHLCEDRESPVRFWKLKNGLVNARRRRLLQSRRNADHAQIPVQG